MKRFSRKQLISMHNSICLKTGGASGIRDEGLLDSAISSPFQTFGGSDLYPTIEEKAARLGFSLIKNHVLIDGNKRIGAHAMLVFLALNKIKLTYTQEELYKIIYHLAEGLSSYEDLLQWIKEKEVH